MSSAAHPESYKAYAFLEKGGPLQVIQVQWRDPAPGEIVVKVLACGICASDEIAKFQLMPQVEYPRIPGHEIVGDVAATPSTENRWKIGNRVGSGWHGGHCNTCVSCMVGDYMTCENEDINGIARHGGYAEYVTLRTEAVTPVPEDMSPAEVAPLFCAGVTTFNSLRNMPCKPPAYVAVQGIGGLGHLGIQFAKAMGYRTVALSSSGSKKQLALALGADAFLDGSTADQVAELKKIGNVRVIMCTAPNADIMRDMIPALAPRGTLLVLALTGDTSVNLGSLNVKGLSIRGWPNGPVADCLDCINFAKANGIKVMVESFPFVRANEAFERRSSALFRAVLLPQEQDLPRPRL
ncbi:GroES-like protein [Wolfiporia cocos MD-104 SS10]|uniref:GroES-like protein n=1 Tax=Wolfiporia cocos (strain MD-104) TaxID=742152 RepID=A0A2H3JH40_WOLCO|nr:GroES-like protein [Wolfiporia cocos MD-104 SS10]